MRHADTGRMLWAWLKENSDTDKFTITKKSIVDSYGDPAIEWKAVSKGGSLSWVSRCVGGDQPKKRK